MKNETTFLVTVIGKTLIFLAVYIPKIVWIAYVNYHKVYPSKQIQTFRSFILLFEITSSLGYMAIFSFDLFIQILFNSLFRKRFLFFIHKPFGKFKINTVTTTVKSIN